MEEQELRRAMAKASLRESWALAKASGLDQMNEEEIDQEIKQLLRRVARDREIFDTTREKSRDEEK
jgi:hypothetical protein